jgi:hypothetical protein
MVFIVACLLPTEIGVAYQTPAALKVSGVVLQHDEKTVIPNMRLQLRNLDTGDIVGRTVSGSDGAYSFDVNQQGTYVVEAIDDHGVRGISSPTSAGTRTIVKVILPSTQAVLVTTAAAYGVVAVAATAGVLALAGRGPTSPER